MTSLASSWKSTVASSSGQRIAVAVLQGGSLVFLLAGLSAREFAFLNLAYWGARFPQPFISFGLAVAAQRYVAEVEPDTPEEEARRSSRFFFIGSTLARLHLGFVLVVVAGWLGARSFVEAPFESLALFLAIAAMQALVISLETFLFQGYQALTLPRWAVLFGGLLRAIALFSTVAGCFLLGFRGYAAFAMAYLAGLLVSEALMLGSLQVLRKRMAHDKSVDLRRVELLSYGLRITAIRVINEFRNAPESFVVAGVFGLELGGILGGYRRLSASLQTIIVSLGLLTGTYTSNLYRRDPVTLQRILASVVVAASFVALGGLLATASIGPFIFEVIFPADFSTKLPYLNLMVALVLGQAIAGNGKSVLEVLGDTKHVFRVQLGFIGLYWISLAVAFLLRSPLLMIVAPGATTIGEYLVYSKLARRSHEIDVSLSPRSVRLVVARLRA